MLLLCPHVNLTSSPASALIHPLTSCFAFCPSQWWWTRFLWFWPLTLLLGPHDELVLRLDLLLTTLSSGTRPLNLTLHNDPPWLISKVGCIGHDPKGIINTLDKILRDDKPNFLKNIFQLCSLTHYIDCFNLRVEKMWFDSNSYDIDFGLLLTITDKSNINQHHSTL